MDAMFTEEPSASGLLPDSCWRGWLRLREAATATSGRAQPLESAVAQAAASLRRLNANATTAHNTTKPSTHAAMRPPQLGDFAFAARKRMDMGLPISVWTNWTELGRRPVGCSLQREMFNAVFQIGRRVNLGDQLQITNALPDRHTQLMGVDDAGESLA